MPGWGGGDFVWPAGRLGELTLFAGADFGETVAEELRESGFDFGSDESDVVEVLDVDAVFEAVAGKFHADQVSDGGDEDAFLGFHGWGFGNGLDVVGAELLVQKHKMHSRPCRGMLSFH